VDENCSVPVAHSSGLFLESILNLLARLLEVALHLVDFSVGF
jgi:hypothetical protein